MCRIKNEMATGILKTIRQLDKGGIGAIDHDDLVAFYTQAYALQKELETAMFIAKERLLKEGVEEKSFPEFGMKIKMTEGRSSTVYDNLHIAKEIGLTAYATITTVVANKAVAYKDVLEKYSKIEKGTPSISVSKLTEKRDETNLTISDKGPSFRVFESLF